MKKIIPRALSIAGSDSGGGAGIQADLKTFTALGVYGMSVITSVTAQNTESVLGIRCMPHEFVELQLDAVLGDIGADAVKIGMLSNERIASSVAKKLGEYGVKKIVVDPVMTAKSGASLLDKDAVGALVGEILPISYIVMPNLPEAGVITGHSVGSVDDMKEAARYIRSLGPEYVLIKGGHLQAPSDALDILYDGREYYEYSAPRVNTRNTHGTGCTYSAAVCTYLARGASARKAAKEAKDYVTGAIKNSLKLGRGHGPLNHFWKYE